MTIRKLSELEQECRDKGLVLTTTRRSKPGKQDYIDLLMWDSLNKYKAEGKLTANQWWIHENIESPKLALSPTQAKAEHVTAFQNSDRVVVQEKLDGCRVLVSYEPGKGFSFFSRNRSVSDYCFADYTNQILGFEDGKFANLFKKSFVLDCELISLTPSFGGRIVTETVLEAVVSCLALNRDESHIAQKEAGYPLRFKCFDLLMVDGKDTFNIPYGKRHEMLVSLIDKIHSHNEEALSWIESVPFHTGTGDEKRKLVSSWIENGGEGGIYKSLDGVYNPKGTRPQPNKTDCWLKQKKTISSALGDDLDCFVTGWKPGTVGTANEGYVGALEFSVYLAPSGRVHHIASCSNFTREERGKMTIKNPDGTFTLNPEYLGKVARVEGMDISSTEGHGSARLVHARFLGWRTGADGKDSTECVFPEAFLNDLAL